MIWNTKHTSRGAGQRAVENSSQNDARGGKRRRRPLCHSRPNPSGAEGDIQFHAGYLSDSGDPVCRIKLGKALLTLYG